MNNENKDKVALTTVWVTADEKKSIQDAAAEMHVSAAALVKLALEKLLRISLSK